MHFLPRMNISLLFTPTSNRATPLPYIQGTCFHECRHTTSTFNLDIFTCDSWILSEIASVWCNYCSYRFTDDWILMTQISTSMMSRLCSFESQMSIPELLRKLLKNVSTLQNFCAAEDMTVCSRKSHWGSSPYFSLYELFILHCTQGRGSQMSGWRRDCTQDKLTVYRMSLYELLLWNENECERSGVQNRFAFIKATNH